LRAFATALVGLLFIAGFPALLFVDSAVRYGRDGEAMVGSARAADLRAALVDATTALVAGEVGGDPALAAVDRVFVRGAVDQVLSAEWFEDSIRSVHAAGVASAVTSRTAAIDLEPFKRALEGRLGLLEERAGDTCRQLFGAGPCADRGHAQEMIASYRRRGQRAISRIPDQLHLWADAGGAENMAALAAARWAGIGVLAVSLVALALLNARRPAVLGGILAAAGLVSLALTFALRLAASGPVARFLLRRARLDERADEPVRVAAAGLRRFAREVIADATTGALIAAAALTLGGIGLVVVSVLRDRRAR
jgi:hypothetical protein